MLCILIVLSVMGGIYAQTKKVAEPSLDSQVKQLIGILRAELIPPAGTPKADVDGVYGEPKETKEFPGGKGSRSDYPMHSYALMEPSGKVEIRADLHVTYRENRVYRLGIRHFCMSAGRIPTSMIPDVGRRQAQIRDIERENRQVLADLLEIYNKYYDKIASASWNVGR